MNGFEGRIVEIRRYPVKSMLGERLESALVGEHGVEGDRRYGVKDLGRDTILSAKREPALFGCSARYDAAGAVTVTLPDGEAMTPGPRLDAALTELIERPVALVAAADHPRARLQGEIDLETGGDPSEWDAPPETFFDASALHFLTTSSLAAARALHPGGDFDPRRFRPNFVVDVAGAEGFVEEGLIGHEVSIGAVTVRVTKPCSRCVMTTHEQAGLSRDPAILRTVARGNANNLGVRAEVVRGGRVEVGDPVGLAPLTRR